MSLPCYYESHWLARRCRQARRKIGGALKVRMRDREREGQAPFNGCRRFVSRVGQAHSILSCTSLLPIAANRGDSELSHLIAGTAAEGSVVGGLKDRCKMEGRQI